MGLLIGVGNTTPQFPYTSLWYGIKINLNHSGKDVSDGKVERVGNLDLHRQLPIQKRIRRFVAKADGTVNYWLGANDSTTKEGGGAAKLNGEDGNVLLYKPDYYRRLEYDAAQNCLVVGISEVELPGFVRMKEQARSPWFATMDRVNNVPASVSCLTWNGDEPARDDNGLLVLTSNAANYRGGTNDSSRDGTYRSELGMPVCNMNKGTARARFKALDASMKYHGGGWRFREEMSWLMAIEFGSLDSEATFTSEKTADGFAQGGLGAQSVDSTQWDTHNGHRPFIPCGITAKLGNNTGRVQYVIKNWANTGTDKTIYVPSYRGWETPQQYLWEENDDVIVHHSKPSEGNESLLYVCEDPTKFVTPSDGATSVPTGYVEVGKLPRASGYISAMAIGNGWSCPTSVAGGAANKGYCDYYWFPEVTDEKGSGWYQLLSCARAYSTENAGVRCAYAINRGAYTLTHCGFPFVLEME